MDAIKLHPEVHGDINAGVRWYNEQQPGLGQRFALEVDASYPRIQANPKASPIRRKDARQYSLHKFPYRIVYVERPRVLWIVAVAHTSRRPNYWVKRLKDIP